MTSDGWTEIVATATPKTANEYGSNLNDLREWLKPYGLEVENLSIVWVKKAGDTYTLVANEYLRRDGHLYLDELTNTPASREISVRVPANSWPAWMNTKTTFTPAKVTVNGEEISASVSFTISGKAKSTVALVGEPGPDLFVTSRERSKILGKRPSDKVIKLAHALDVRLEEWQKEVIRQWFDK